MANREGRTGNAIFVFNGHGYKLSVTEEHRYYKCTEERTLGCNARGNVEDDVMILTRPHCHPPMIERWLIEGFKDELWIQVVSTEERINSIYRRVALTSPQAAALVPFITIERSMNRWRQQSHAPTPRTLLQYSLIVNRNEWRQYRNYNDGTMIIETIYIDRETSVTVYGDPQFLSTLDNIQELYLDATFSDCPRALKIMQLFTIMGRVDDSAILKRIKKKGRATWIKFLKWEIALAFYRKLLALPLLPANQIQRAFQWLIDNASADILDFFRDLIAYYRRYWLRTIGTGRLSVYRQANRTNNPIEAYHRILHTQFGSYPSIWPFTVKMKELQILTRIQVNSLNRGLEIRHPAREEYRIRETIIHRMWHLYDAGTLTLSRFLSCYNHVSPALNNQMVIAAELAVDQFQHLPAHNINIQPRLNEENQINIEGINEELSVGPRSCFMAYCTRYF